MRGRQLVPEGPCYGSLSSRCGLSSYCFEETSQHFAALQHSDLAPGLHHACECTASGFVPTAAGGEVKCLDRDECAEVILANSSLCHQHAECVNAPGSYVCHCLPGYWGDGFQHCEGINPPRRATLEYEIDDVGQNCFVCERPGERLGR